MSAPVIRTGRPLPHKLVWGRFVRKRATFAAGLCQNNAKQRMTDTNKGCQRCCRYSTLLGSYMKDGITKHITHNNSSIQVQVDMPRADQETGIGFFSSTGKGDIAFYRVMSECTTGHQSVGIFDCSGSTIDPRAKSTINPRDLL